MEYSCFFYFFVLFFQHTTTTQVDSFERGIRESGNALVDDHVAGTKEQSVEEGRSTEHVQEVNDASFAARSLLAQHFVLSATRTSSLLPSMSSGTWKKERQKIFCLFVCCLS